MCSRIYSEMAVLCIMKEAGLGTEIVISRSF